jgi:hypothetical protein
MPESTTLDLYQDLPALTNTLDVNCSYDDMGPWIAHLNISVRALSAKSAQDGAAFDYYFVEVDGEAQYDGHSDWKLAAHGVDLFPEAPDLSQVQLLEESPATTIGARSYTTELTHTIGGSIGFDKDGLHLSLTGEVSSSRSSTYEIADLSIQNISRAECDPLLNGSWRFEVTAGSPIANANCPLDVATLYQAPHGTALQLKVACSVYLIGGDARKAENIAEHLKAGNPQMEFGLPLAHPSPADVAAKQVHPATVAVGAKPLQGYTFDHGLTDPWYNDKVSYTMNKMITLAVPPPPA